MKMRGVRDFYAWNYLRILTRLFQMEVCGKQESEGNIGSSDKVGRDSEICKEKKNVTKV